MQLEAFVQKGRGQVRYYPSVGVDLTNGVRLDPILDHPFVYRSGFVDCTLVLERGRCYDCNPIQLEEIATLLKMPYESCYAVARVWEDLPSGVHGCLLEQKDYIFGSSDSI